MKILVVCQYYYPEPFRISDICEALVRRGHEVTVVTGVPNYPEGEIYKGYENGSKRDEIINGVNVYRCHTIPRKTGAIYRLLNYNSYSYSSSHFVGSLPDDFDVVFINQLSPVMMAKAGIKYAKKYKKPCGLYCLDLWPKSLAVGGINESSLIYRHYHRVSARIYRAVDKILITSRSFSDYFEKEFEIDKNIITYLPQYAEEIFEASGYQEPNGVCNLMFAGNIGTAQSVITIVKAAELLKDEPIRFHLVGSGIELDSLKEYAEKHRLNSIVFYGRKPLEEMPRYYAMADAMLLTLQADPVLSLTLPGKLQSYMSAGKPVIAAIDGEAQRVIEEARCGYCSPAEDAEALAGNIRRFADEKDKQTLARNARTYYEQHFDKRAFMDQLEDVFESMIIR